MHLEILSDKQKELLPFFASGRRAKWKDYVDLYFLINQSFSIEEITMEAKKIFDAQFSEKLFREQLAFHKDIDYREEVEFLPGYFVEEKEVRAFLVEQSLEQIY